MRIVDLDSQYQDYLKDPYSSSKHKLKSVELTLRSAKGDLNIAMLKHMKKVLKMRVSKGLH